MSEPVRTQLSAETAPETQVVIGLSAVVIAVTEDRPKVLVVRRPYAPLQSGAARQHHFMDKPAKTTASDFDSRNWLGLPFGPFDPDHHRTMEIGLRAWVEEQTKLEVGYVEQLYTFGDRDRYMGGELSGPRVVSVGYLALAPESALPSSADGLWDDWYRYFPWEDWREGKPSLIENEIRPALEEWITASNPDTQERRGRAHMCFGLDDMPWDEEKVLERYELLYEVGLAGEALRDQGQSPIERDIIRRLGTPMQFDHRRILATAMGRLRGKLKYRPVVFELMAPEFTLFELQRTVEAVAGIRVHKQNFRRLVERSGLVESTGHQTSTGGRPAATFRFRREVLRERSAAGMRVTRTRTKKPGP